jgi:16S rRNA (guanine966-N2)-methyltransferase
MRIVGGRHRGRTLEAPAGNDIRPTSDRARQALFNILEHGAYAAAGSRLIDQPVLDAFAGTGAVGLEALSRGAVHATFMELAPATLRQNIARLGEQAKATVLTADATRPPRAPGACGIAFLDPPYGKGLGTPALTALRQQGWLRPGTLAILEVQAREAFDPPEGFVLADERRYGAARLLFLEVVSG